MTIRADTLQRFPTFGAAVGQARYDERVALHEATPPVFADRTTVEIKTGSRTVMSYLLSPLLRYKQDSLRER